MHTLLERQLRRAGFSPEQLPTNLSSWQEFLQRISVFYENADQDRLLREAQLADLQQSELDWREIFGSIKQGVCFFDANNQLYFANQTARDTLPINDSVDATQILQQFELHTAVNPDVIAEPNDLLLALKQHHHIYDQHARLKTADNTFQDVLCLLNPIIAQQQWQGCILLFSDIADLKKVEQDLLLAKQRAEKASQAKSQFLSSMSHELRTPMNAILGYSELLKEDLSLSDGDVDHDAVEDMQQYVGNILKAGWHLLDLINKVLDLTRIEAGKLEVHIERIDVVDLVNECESLITPLAEQRNIQIDNQAKTLKPHYALIDRSRLKQVIINLLSNAVKYNRDNGSITIQLQQPSANMMKLSVIDTGPGLSAEQKQQVFDPFTRFTGKNLIEGTGIGLTITRQLLEMMDGSVDVESTEGEGSHFWIELPTGEVEEEDVSEYNQHIRKYILLYIEDSRTNISLVAQILKNRPDIAMMSAQTGEMGLELARMHQPDMILLDINLPGIDGFEVFDTLRADESTANIPVIALSAVDTQQNLRRGEDAGFVDYIVKPLNIRKFLAAIENALSASSKKQSAAIS